MRFEDALSELGIGVGASAEEARRAYLRRLKRHKPETDPEGFRRLREAYELVRDPTAFAVLDAEAIPLPSLSHESAPRSAGPGDPEGFSPRTDPRALVAAGKLKSAARELATQYESSAALDAVTTPQAFAIDLLLRLHERGALKTAERLESAFRCSPAGQDRMSPNLGARWALARELGALPRELSTDVRAALAVAARLGDARTAVDLVDRLRRTEMERAEANLTLVREYAPAFAQWFKTAARDGRAFNHRRPLVGAAITAGVVALAFVFRALTAPTAPPHVEAPAPLARATAEQAADRLERRATDAHQMDIATDATFLWQGLEAGCDRVWEPVLALEALAPSASSDLRPLLLDAVQKSRRACGYPVTIRDAELPP